MAHKKIKEENEQPLKDGFMALYDFNANRYYIGSLKNEAGDYKKYDLLKPEKIADSFRKLLI